MEATKRWHQNITLDGVDQPAEYGKRKHSAFFNEGKWRNFIEPLLPPDPTDRTFIEIGCNVGLFLKMATEYGFRSVVGVEADGDACAMAERYRDANGMNYKILHRAVGRDFDWNELPAADVVLLANVHYYIPMADFLPFLDRMLHKTIYCIVVSREMHDRKHGYPLPDDFAIRAMFQDWRTVRQIATSTNLMKRDPAARVVHSQLFQSRLQRQPIEEHTKRIEYEALKELLDLARAGGEIRLEDTLKWKFWKTRKQDLKEKESDKWSDDEIRAYVQNRLDWVRDVLDNGVKEPILIRPDRIGIDGGHRAAMLKLMGYKSVICRIV